VLDVQKSEGRRMQCDNCNTAVGDGVTNCPTCGAEYKKQESLVLGLLRFFGSLCVLLGAFMYFKFHSTASAIVLAGFGVGWHLLVRILSARVPYRWFGGAKVGEPKTMDLRQRYHSVVVDFLGWSGLLPVDFGYDPDFCRRAMRIVSAICAALVLVTAIILVATVPGHDRCPTWTDEQIHNLTVFTTVAAFWTAWISFNAIKWDRAKRKLEESWAKSTRYSFPVATPNQAISAVGIASVLFCAVPLAMVIMFATCARA
jgi:hypothetical protein